MADDRPFHNPFDVLRSLKRTETGPAPPEAPAPEPPPVRPTSARGSRTIARAVVRMERSGRGGKDVTVVEQLGLSEADRAVWLKALKAQLGCGGVVEGDALMLQGDHRKRLPALLTARGVKKVTIG